MRQNFHRLFFGFFVLFVASFILIAGDHDSSEVKLLYKKAESLYNDPEITDQKDSIALSAYYRLISILESTHQQDSILWDSYFKAATYEQTIGHYQQAIHLFIQNLALKKKLNGIPGELAFLPNLYIANSYYLLNRFDSARYFYSEAEKVSTSFPVKEGIERLYNAFGILNFETGNYTQSKNNFEKAISIASANPNPSPGLMVNFRSNLASSLRKLNEYDRAIAVYKELLPLNLNVDELLQNIAASYLGKGDYLSGLEYLRKVKASTQNTLNSFGLIFTRIGQFDSAARFLDSANKIGNLETQSAKTIDNGLTSFYQGALDMIQNKWEPAIQNYQTAITRFLYSFNDSNIYHNPTDYAGCFAVIELYETLLAKSKSFRQLYTTSGNIKHLEAALDGLRSLYSLIDHAEKTYESDEARILLNQKKHLSHHIPINLCIELFKKTKNTDYLKEAFYFDERNKASVLSIGISEKQLKRNADIPESLLMEETNCKELINSLSMRASNSRDDSSLAEVQVKIRDQQLKLEAIEKKMNSFPNYARLKFTNNTINIEELQSKVIPPDGAILSFHWGDSTMLTWVISKNKLEFVETPIGNSLITSINKLYSSLIQIDKYSDRENRDAIRQLYSTLIEPLEEKIKGFTQLMIIPDDELNYVPFGMLLNQADERALENFDLSYNYSCTLLRKTNRSPNQRENLSLAMAPYTESENNLSKLDLPQLPGSAQEIGQLRGKILTGVRATKDSFVLNASRFPIIHLATHAFANDKDPNKSFIAFYPTKVDSTNSGRLYVPEIYNLDLNSTKLVLLSACETGGGQLVRGEGIISLARAFYYAGCPNMITSQWKAEDQSTAYITQRTHYYLEKNYGIAKALRAAKQDYIKDQNIDSRIKTPAYWEHLRFTGQFDYQQSIPLDWLWVLIPFIIVFTVITIKKIRPGTKPSRKNSS